MAKEESAHDAAGQVDRAGQANLAGPQTQSRRLLQGAADGSDNGGFQTIQHPGDPQGNHQQPVKAGPGETIEPEGDIGGDPLGVAGSRWHGVGAHAPPKDLPSPQGRGFSFSPLPAGERGEEGSAILDAIRVPASKAIPVIGYSPPF